MTVQASVVIPAYNARRFIVESISSVIAQENAPPFEIIVVDDGSSDGTAVIVTDTFPDVRVIRKANGGPGSARNVGVQSANSDIILFHDADDIMIQGRIAAQANFMALHPDFAMSLGDNISDIDMPESEAALLSCLNADFQDDSDFLVKILTGENYSSANVMAVRKSAFLLANGFPVDVKVAEDLELGVKICEFGRVAKTNAPMNWYRKSNSSSITKSHNVYVDPVVVRLRALNAKREMLDGEIADAALRKWHQLLKMHVRNVWVTRGSAEARNELRRYRSDISKSFYIVWFSITLLPPWTGSTLKLLKRALLQSVKAEVL